MLYGIVDVCLPEGLRPSVIASKICIIGATSRSIVVIPTALVGAIGDRSTGIGVRIHCSTLGVTVIVTVVVVVV